MALDTLAGETTATPEPEWNEDKLVLSLNRLQEMHAQVYSSASFESHTWLISTDLFFL